MSNNRFEFHNKAKLKLILDDRASDQEITNYLLASSLEYTGNPLKFLLPRDDIKVCREFIELMASHNYPGAVDLKLERKVPLKTLTKHEVIVGSWYYRKRSHLFAYFRWQKLWQGKGYQIGVISNSPTVFISEINSTPVYLCSDLKLRCQRDAPLFRVGQTYAAGAGTIPEKIIQNYSFYIGRLINSSSLEEMTFFKTENLEDLLIDISEMIIEMLP